MHPPTRADDWRRPYPGWPGTRYEAKALAAGVVVSAVAVVAAKSVGRADAAATESAQPAAVAA